MATDIYIPNSTVGTVQNGLVTVMPMPGQVGKAGPTNQGLDGFVLSYRTATAEDRVTTATADQAQMQSGYRFRGEIGEQPLPMSSSDTASAVGADVTLHYAAAGPGYSHVLEGIAFGYGSTPAAGASIRIEDGAGNIVFKEPVTASGPFSVRFDPKRRGTPNTDLYVILSNGGASVSGNVSALGHWLL